MNWKEIFKNTIAIFFAFIPMMILMILLWFFLMMDVKQEENAILNLYNYTTEKINVLEKQMEWGNNQISQQREQLHSFINTHNIHNLRDFKDEKEQNNWIEILRIQINQCEKSLN